MARDRRQDARLDRGLSATILVGVVAPSPELSVVCKSCGSEVSPYVTECPYCGTRLRKRAPKLERQGAKSCARRESRADKRRRKAAERRQRRERGRFESLAVAGRPYATIAAIAAPALLLIVERAPTSTVDRPRRDRRAGRLRVVALPGGALGLRRPRLPLLRRRRARDLRARGRASGSAPSRRCCCDRLRVARDARRRRARPGLRRRRSRSPPAATASRSGSSPPGSSSATPSARSDPTVEYDRIGVAVAAAVLLLLPVVDDLANVSAGLAGGLVGGACGLSAALGRAPRRREQVHARSPTSSTPTWSSTARARTTSCAGCARRPTRRRRHRGDADRPRPGRAHDAARARDRRPAGDRGRHLHRLLGDLHRPRPARRRRARRLRARARSAPRSPAATSSEAGLADRIDLRIGPGGRDARAALPADEPFDFAFIDADKHGLPRLLRGVPARGCGPAAWSCSTTCCRRPRARPARRRRAGEAIWRAERALAADERVDLAMAGIADGITIALRRKT